MKLWNYQTPNLIPKLTPQGRYKSLLWMALGKSLTNSLMIVVEKSKDNGQQNYHGPRG
jgi:hypothetical protein